MFQSLGRALKRFRGQTWMGEDAAGNQYYLIATEEGVASKRIVEPKSMEDYDLAKIPPEWNAWLSARRDDPPSPEESQQRLLAAQRLKEKVKRLEEKDAAARVEEFSQRGLAPPSIGSEIYDAAAAVAQKQSGVETAQTTSMDEAEPEAWNPNSK